MSTKEEPLANVMGAGSVGLALPMTTMPGRFLHLIGVEDDAKSRAVTLAVGAQEWSAAAGIFGIERPRPVVTMWSRFAGDLMHLGLLARAWGTRRESSVRLAGAIAYVVGCGVADFTGALRLTRDSERTMKETSMQVRTSTTIRASREDLYALWRDFENLPGFMYHLESVERTGDRRSHWKAKGPAGRSVEWDAEITQERPNELIAWRSLDGADVENSGTVRFVAAPGGRGTEIHLEMDAATPAGKVGELIAKAFGEDPLMQAKDDLRRLKQVMETGEVVRSEGTPEGQATRRLFRQRPAQPPEQEVRDATAPAAGVGAEGGRS